MFGSLSAACLQAPPRCFGGVLPQLRILVERAVPNRAKMPEPEEADIIGEVQLGSLSFFWHGQTFANLAALSCYGNHIDRTCRHAREPLLYSTSGTFEAPGGQARGTWQQYSRNGSASIQPQGIRHLGGARLCRATSHLVCDLTAKVRVPDVQDHRYNVFTTWQMQDAKIGAPPRLVASREVEADDRSALRRPRKNELETVIAGLHLNLDPSCESSAPRSPISRCGGAQAP